MAKSDDWKTIKPLTPFIGLDGNINCDFEQCPLKKKTVSFPIDIKHPQVIAFAKAMDEVLTKNDYKGGWGESACTLEYLQARLVEEMGEYFGLMSNDKAYTPQKARKELIDVANFCMMLFNRS